MEFEEKVKNLLIEAGWKPGRQVDISQYKLVIENEGYKLSSAVEMFLQQFGGLYIRYPLPNSQSDIVHFDVIKSVRDTNPFWVKDEYSQRLNNFNLCVIGQAFTNHMTIIMDNYGNVYGGYDDNLYFIADSGEDAIRIICLNKKLEEIE